MSSRPLTDIQISEALRAHLPEVAAPGLRERVFNAAETTDQLRSFPSFLGALSDADPVSRRRNLLIAAALLLALAVASGAAVGAWRLLQPDPIDDLSLERPADVQAFVLSSYERLPQLPPLALTWRASDSTKGRIYVDRSGAVRLDRFASADATEPTSYRIMSPDHRISGMATVDSEAVWVEPGHEAIGEDPRVFLRTVLTADERPGCEIERDSSGVGNGAAGAGWRYVGLEYIAGRPTHHVACAGELWIDIETRLILRTQGPTVDDAGQPIPVVFTEVTEIAFAEQPGALFEPPQGLGRISEEEYSAYICARDLPNELAPGISDCPSREEPESTPPTGPSPEPTQTQTVDPDTNDCAVPPGDRSEPIGPLAWTPESMKDDWPAPVRREPAAGGNVEPMPRTYLDATGDNGSEAYPCVDIRWVMADTSEVRLKLVSKPPPWTCSEQGECFGVDPTEQRIAYGVVIDDDGDGVPDWRYGIDNIPGDAAEKGPPRRGWRTNLHTGQTEAGPEHSEWIRRNGGGFKSGLPSETAGLEPDATLWFGGDVETTQGSQEWGFELDMPFYAWASVIVDGRVVATDYAPDAGWLVATRGVRPAGTSLLDDPFPHLSMTVPEGWTADLERVKCGDLPRDFPPDTAYSPYCALVRFDVIDESQDLCEETIEPRLGSGFDDLVNYVAGLPTIVTPRNADVTVDGYRGKHFQYSERSSYLGIDCFVGYDDIWILDVDGVHLMIRSQIGGVSDHYIIDLDLDVAEKVVKAEIRRMVESIEFER